MASLETMINEPVPISLISGRYLLFDINVVTYLRRIHRICGVLIGSIPQIPQQNVFLGLPVELLPEEVKLLVEEEVAYIIDDVSRHRETLYTLASHDRRRYLDSLRVESRKARKVAKEISQKRIERGLAKQALLQASKNASEPTISGPSTEPTDVTNLANRPPSEGTKFTDRLSLPTSTPTVLSPAHYTVTPTTTHATFSLPQNYIQQQDPVVPTSYALFCQLHALQYFITPGLRFGCDYTVYPGDPLRFHSHFLAVGHDWEKETPLIDLVGGGRLGTGVKKGFLIGGEDPGVREHSHHTVRTFCIEWGGM